MFEDSLLKDGGFDIGIFDDDNALRIFSESDEVDILVITML